MKPKLPAQFARGLTDVEKGVCNAVLRRVERLTDIRIGYSSLDQGEIDDILRRPHVAAALEVAMRNMLVADMAPAALARLDDIVRNPDTPNREAISAAKTILDRAGIVQPPQRDDDGDRPMDELSREDLLALVSDANRELSERSVEIEEPNVIPPGPKNPIRSLKQQENPRPSGKMKLGPKRRKDSIFD